MMHSILIIGQSNMGGRGFKEDVEPIKNDKEEIINTSNIYYLIKYLITSSEIISNYNSTNSNS